MYKKQNTIIPMNEKLYKVFHENVGQRLDISWYVIDITWYEVKKEVGYGSNYYHIRIIH